MISLRIGIQNSYNSMLALVICTTCMRYVIYRFAEYSSAFIHLFRAYRVQMYELFL